MTGPIQGETTTASADICSQTSLLSPADRTCLRLSLTSLDYLENVKHWAQIIYCFILSHYFMPIKFLRIGTFDPCTEHTLSEKISRLPCPVIKLLPGRQEREIHHVEVRG